MGMTLETWVFGTIFVLVGFLLITCGLKEAEFSLVFMIAGGSYCKCQLNNIFQESQEMARAPLKTARLRWLHTL
jgi:hypothetical protein